MRSLLLMRRLVLSFVERAAPVACATALHACSHAPLLQPPPLAPAFEAAPSTSAPLPPPPNPTTLVTLLRDAYRAHAAGRTAGAREAFMRVAQLTLQGGGIVHRFEDVPHVDLASARGGLGAASTPLGTLFFRAGDGEPIAFDPDVVLDRFSEERRLPKAPIFVVRIAQELALYDATTLAPFAHASGFHLSLDGKVAYGFQESDCRWHVWELGTRQELQILEARGGPPACKGENEFAYSFLTPDGRWLFGPGGRWDLQTHRLHRFPGPSLLVPYLEPAVGPAGRFLAYFRREWPIKGDFGHVELVLFDLQQGSDVAVTTDPSFVRLSNGSPLYFLESPARLRVFDYSTWVYSIPSLKLVVRVPMSPSGREDDSVHHSPGQKRALSDPNYAPRPRVQDSSQVAPRVCYVGELPIPSEFCVEWTPR